MTENLSSHKNKSIKQTTGKGENPAWKKKKKQDKGRQEADWEEILPTHRPDEGLILSVYKEPLSADKRKPTASRERAERTDRWFTGR